MSQRFRVVRMVVYEGDYDWLSKTLRMSLPTPFVVGSNSIQTFTIGQLPKAVNDDDNLVDVQTGTDRRKEDIV